VTRVLQFTVAGIAATKGSGRTVVSRSTGKAIYLHDNPRTKDWQAAVGWSAAAAIAALGGGMPFPSGPVTMAVVFYLPRPKALLTKRHAAIDVPHVKKPDLDKTVRAAFDALSGIAWTDDSQVTDLIARKRYCAAGAISHAVIRVRASALAGGPYAD
jgi:Holliday junction resolvase RusA-like endonuclease